MHEFRPHSFDTRGFLSALKYLAFGIALCVGATYGAVFTFGHFTVESQTALAAETAEPPATAPQEIIPPAPTPETSAPVFSVGETEPPRVSARAFVVGDVASSVVFAHKNSVEAYPIASLTKLLTALVAEGSFNASSTITLLESDKKHTEGSPGSLPSGQTFALYDALRALLMESNNSIANALARAGGGDVFLAAMRIKARAIGMDAATFEDPSGLSKHNAASALDLLLLIRHLYSEAPDILEMARARGIAITAESGRTFSLGNYNVFSGNPQFVGGKTGYTDAAKQTYASIFEIPVGSTTATIAIVVLGSEDRKRDTEALLKWFKSNARPTE